MMKKYLSILLLTLNILYPRECLIQYDENDQSTYISGTLQYLENYQSCLKMITDIQPNFVIINRTPFWDFKPTAIKQFMGGNSNATNAAWIFNEKEIFKIIIKKYSKLSAKFDINDNPYLVPY